MHPDPETIDDVLLGIELETERDAMRCTIRAQNDTICDQALKLALKDVAHADAMRRSVRYRKGLWCLIAAQWLVMAGMVWRWR